MKIIREFEIPVCYSVTGRVTIKAESVEDARQKLASSELVFLRIMQSTSSLLSSFILLYLIFLLFPTNKLLCENPKLTICGSSFFNRMTA